MVSQYLILNFTFLRSLFFGITEPPKKETLAQVFSCEFCEISKKTFLNRTSLVADSLPL